MEFFAHFGPDTLEFGFLPHAEFSVKKIPSKLGQNKLLVVNFRFICMPKMWFVEKFQILVCF